MSFVESDRCVRGKLRAGAGDDVASALCIGLCLALCFCAMLVLIVSDVVFVVTAVSRLARGDECLATPLFIAGAAAAAVTAGLLCAGLCGSVCCAGGAAAGRRWMPAPAVLVLPVLRPVTPSQAQPSGIV